MSLVIEKIDKSKGKVTQPKELNEIHNAVLEILNPSRLPEISRNSKVETEYENRKPVPTKLGLKLQDALLSGKTHILRTQINPMQEGVKGKISASEIIDKVINIKLIDIEEQKRCKKGELITLINKIKSFIVSEDKTKEELDEIISGISNIIQYLNIICSNVDELCEYRNYLSEIRCKLINLYSDKLGNQKVR